MKTIKLNLYEFAELEESAREKAIEANPVTREPRLSRASIERPGGWKQLPDSEIWTNGLDWHSHKEIGALELDPVKQPIETKQSENEAFTQEVMKLNAPKATRTEPTWGYC